MEDTQPVGGSKNNDWKATTRKQVLLKFGGSGLLDKVVMVSWPLSLPELQHTAAQNFGHSGCLRLYHQGSVLLYHPMQLTQVQDGDIIIVRKSDSHRPSTSGTPRMQSTHQADFIKHSMDKYKGHVGADYESCLTERTKGAVLDGMSRYATDYVKHPILPCQPYQPPAALHLINAKLDTSTYKREFPWREGGARAKGVDDKAVRESSLSMASQMEKFAGDSSYSIDYPKRPYTSPRATMVPTVSVKPPPTKFSPDTTYSNDFKKLAVNRHRGVKPSDTSGMDPQPFHGTSEYRREYLERGQSGRSPMCIQLAEEAFDGQCSQGLSQAAEAALKDGLTVDLQLPVTPEMRLQGVDLQLPKTPDMLRQALV